MKITVITLFPQMIECFINQSIVARAIKKKLVEIEIVNLRDFAKDKYGTVDDRPYGGGTGMLLKVDCLKRAIDNVKCPVSRQGGQMSNVKCHKYTILTSARGSAYNQEKARAYSKLNHLVIVAGHYEGVDERVSHYVDEEVSLGDFVMTGGEITASAIIDSVVRLLPNVLKKNDAVEEESFFQISINRLIEILGEKSALKSLKKKGVKKVRLLEYPQYTRPEEYKRLKVPPVLLSGDHKKIEKWRLQQAYNLTKKRRPDLFLVNRK